MPNALDPATKLEHVTSRLDDAHAAAWDLLDALDRIRDLDVSNKVEALRAALHEALGETHRVRNGKGETSYRALEAIKHEAADALAFDGNSPVGDMDTAHADIEAA